ncbi:glycosyltransferase [Crenalkalicoccus roseus]|uniref:glycosyltransferase n=1 Tax=Crenalkalicoccus roseus TaxID=1485588 RepID=UPI001081CF00|nr:glycosyltransferase [Crenalkalicoccus roseus]
MARILIAGTGSLGDLHPFLALGRGLAARGHRVTLAHAPSFRAHAAAAGLGFAPLRPDYAALLAADAGLRARTLHPARGAAAMWREIIAPHLRASHADLLAAAAEGPGCDLLIHAPTVAVAPLVAEQRGIPWAPALLQPFALFSVHDPSLPPGLPWLAERPWLHRLLAPGIRRLGLGMMRRWSAPVAALRAELGLPPAGYPLLNAARPPRFGLALFSSLLAARQPDWPPRLAPTGFPFWDGPDPEAPSPAEAARIAAFLAEAAGPPPIVFTLGSAAFHRAGAFWRESLEAARRLGRRALLLTGRAEGGFRPGPLPGWALAVGYAPHAEIFPRAAAIVHQGGIGTTGQAMRAGRPMLVVPFANDQPDNANRLRRLGIAAVLPEGRYTASAAATALSALLRDAQAAARARAVAEAVRAEDGVGAACDAVEAGLAA